MKKKKKGKTHWALLILLFWIAYFFQFDAPNPSTKALPGEAPKLYCTQVGDYLQDTLIHDLDSAKQSIILMIYTLRDAKIIQALNKKAEEGVLVKVIYDADASKGIESKLSSKIYQYPRAGTGLMHLKLLTIDSHSVWLSSANMCRDSLKKHANLLTHIDQPDIAKLLEKKADQIIGESYEKPLLPFSCNLEGQTIELRFLPDDQKAVSKLTQLLNSAQKTIKVAMYTFTRQDLADCLLAAKKRGVKVEVVVDESTGKGASQKIVQFLQQKKIPLFLSSEGGMMHHKFVLIDDQTLALGSANWTKAAFKQNDDYIMILSKLNPSQQKVMDALWKNLAQKKS